MIKKKKIGDENTMTHIERMEEELRELHERLDKATKFLTKERDNPELLDRQQYFLLDKQVYRMYCYAEVLEERIAYDKEKK